jgi:phosphatidylglycerophosphatase A
MKKAMTQVAASALGLGHLPVAPGTWASAGAAVVYVLLRCTAGSLAIPLLAWLLLGVIVLGMAVCPSAQEVYDQEDPAEFVLDEVAGYWLTCMLFQWRGPVLTAIAAFVAFRIFDIAKPFPIRRIETIPGAWGVMLDDLAAGVYAAALAWAVCHGLIDGVLLG